MDMKSSNYTGLFMKESCYVCGREDYALENCPTPEVCCIESIPSEDIPPEGEFLND